jgi:hypothetical protein
LINENLNNEKKIEDLFQEIDEQEQSVWNPWKITYFHINFILYLHF